MKAVRVTDDLWLMDREALAQWTRRSAHTIRAKCLVHSYAADGRAMYDAHECAKTLERVAQSGRHAA
jgi:hypothetical protein